MFGYHLGDMSTRMARLAEGLEVVIRLLRSDEPVTYEGRFFQLRDARLLPRPQRPGGLPLLVPASGSKRGLPLAARYADIWNSGWLTPEAFRELSRALTKLLRTVGRPPSAVKGTMMTFLFYSHTPAHLERRTRAIRRFLLHLADKPLDALLATLRTEWHALMGTHDQIVERINAYVAAGVEALMLEWLDPEDLDGLHAFAAAVLPRLST